MIFRRKQTEATKKARNARGKQGASRVAAKRNAPRLSVALNPEWFSVAKAVLLTAVMGIGIAMYGGVLAVKTVLDIPVEQVEIAGELSYQSRQQIAGVINQYVVDGFVSVDLAELQQELVALPWIYQASIKRQLDQALLISLQEQQPVAYWNHDALLNQYGEVFTPKQLPQVNGLPLFAGKDHQRVLGVYKQLLVALPETQLPLRALSIDGRNVVQVNLVSQTELVMNYAQLNDQLERWYLISNQALAERLNDVKRVDLRYSNGAAVSWNNSVAAAAAAHQ